ncbi:MAG: hypothetical protein E7183_05580 [Erysipelotrichaceae bacterium]|nr:hypothetical protein [Erysipelotrichaceae bacterium]
MFGLSSKNKYNREMAERKLEQRKREIIKKYSENGDYIISDTPIIYTNSSYGYNKEDIIVEYIEYYKEEIKDSQEVLTDISVDVIEDDEGNIRANTNPHYETRDNSYSVVRERVKYLTDEFYIKTVKRGMAQEIAEYEDELAYNMSKFEECKTEFKIDPDLSLEDRNINFTQYINVTKCTIFTCLQVLLPVLIFLYALIFPYNFTLFDLKNLTMEKWFISIQAYDKFFVNLNLNLNIVYFILLGLIVTGVIFEQIFYYDSVDLVKSSSFDFFINKIAIYSYIFLVFELIFNFIPSERKIVAIPVLLLCCVRTILYFILIIRFLYSLGVAIAGGHYSKLKRSLKARAEFINSGKFNELLEYEKIVIESTVY